MTATIHQLFPSPEPDEPDSPVTIEPVHIRIAKALIESGAMDPLPDERLATKAVPCGFACMHRNLYGPEMCQGCPENYGGDTA